MTTQDDLHTHHLAYSVAEFCKVSGLGRSLIYEVIKSGRLTVRKIGSRTLILRTDAEKFLLDLPVNRSLQRQMEDLSKCVGASSSVEARAKKGAQ